MRIQRIPQKESIIRRRIFADRHSEVVAIIPPPAHRQVSVVRIDLIELVSDGIRERLRICTEFKVELGIQPVNSSIRQEKDKLPSRLDRAPCHAADLVRQQSEPRHRRIYRELCPRRIARIRQVRQPDRIAHEDQRLPLHPRMDRHQVVVATLVGSERLEKGIVQIGIQHIADRHRIAAIRDPEAVANVGPPPARA